jgi:tRNA A-37 threonylcarbamoyl transferase component Bud32
MPDPIRTHERQNFHGRKLKPPRVAILRLVNGQGGLSQPWGRRERPFYVDVQEGNAGELILWTRPRIPVGQRLQMFIHRFPARGWRNFEGRVTWVQADLDKSDNHFIGCTATPAQVALPTPPTFGNKPGPFPADYEFFLTIPFLRGIHRDSVCPLLNCIRYRSVRAGDRFIGQGDEGDAGYIVQRGTCRVVLEKHGQHRPLVTIREREFVGEMALLTGEPRSAHVEALTDMELWSISRDEFEQLIQSDPVVGVFLTEIVAEKFASRKFTADRHIGEYVITDIIGRGAFAIVYDGYHARDDRPVAIKMLRHDLAMNQEFLGNFRKEALTIAGFSHENIVKVLDIEERFRTLYIIMERLEGCSLRGRLDKDGRLSIQETLNVLIQVCRALVYAHERAIVHQDVNPANIFLLPDAKVKLLDFGLAGPCGSLGLLSGTPYYMSPEQIECLSLDERADIYALGLTAYEMVCGQRPFKETNAFKVMNLHLEQDIPDPTNLVPDLPVPFREFILKACNRAPGRRYRTASQVIGALQFMSRKIA